MIRMQIQSWTRKIFIGEKIMWLKGKMTQWRLWLNIVFDALEDRLIKLHAKRVVMD